MSGKTFQATEFEKHLADVIQTRRLMHGMAQKDLANKVGVSFQQIQKYETVANRISADMLKRIADAFELTVGQLIDETCRPHVQDTVVVDLIKLMYSKMDAKQRKIVLTIVQYMTGV